MTADLAEGKRGPSLRSHQETKLRPTADRVKGALFNILRSRLENARFLDLYAGTGAVGLEALRYGARSTVLVEKSHRAIGWIKKKLNQDPESEVTLLQMDVVRAISQLSAEGRQFDLVFLDPPYDRGLVSCTLAALARTVLLPAGAIIVVEHSMREESLAEGFTLIRTYRYGDTRLSLMERSMH
jgi:16S rRNA (guanine966-N2)-methyltransferase